MEWFSVKKCCFKQNQNVPRENVFVLRLAAIQRNWSPAALFNDQIQLGGDQRWRCDKANVVMLQRSGKVQNVFPTVQKRRPDLLCFIELFLKNHLLSLAHPSCHPIVFTLWKPGADLMATLDPFKPLILE